MKVYVFAVRTTNKLGTTCVLSQVYPTYKEAWEKACQMFNQSCNVSEIVEVEV